jgi:hypothetical protein
MEPARGACANDGSVLTPSTATPLPPARCACLVSRAAVEYGGGDYARDCRRHRPRDIADVRSALNPPHPRDYALGALGTLRP